MGRKDALAAITNTKRTDEEVARDVDWRKVWRVQHGLRRPSEPLAASSQGMRSHEEMERAARRRARATTLAHVLAFLSGVFLGLAILRVYETTPMLLAVSIACVLAAVSAASWAHS